MKVKKNTTLILSSLLLITGVNSCSEIEDCEATCSSFSSQSEAQRAFNESPSCLSNLDRDNDGIACE